MEALLDGHTRNMRDLSSVFDWVTNAQARAKYYDQYVVGQQKGVPETPSSSRWVYIDPPERDESFVLVGMPLEQVDCLAASEERAARYTEILMTNDMGPSWGICKEKERPHSRRMLAMGDDRIVFLVDGNHRAVAARRNGFSTISVWLPESSYANYRERIRFY